MKIVVTVPAYNEGKTLAPLLKEINKVMTEHKYKYTLLVVDDGSKDNTAEVAQKGGATVHSFPQNYGLAEVFRTEIQKSLELKADVIVHIDADGQYLPKEIPKLIEQVEKGNDLVLGSRFKGKIESMPIIKKMGNRAFSSVISRITGAKISDGQTGFRAFTRQVAEEIDIISTHTYTQEQIIKAVRQKFKIKEVPIFFAKRDGKSRLISNPLEYAIKAWINILRIYRDYEPLKFFGKIGGAMFIVGFAIGLYLVYVHLTSSLAGRHFGLMLFDVLLLSISIQTILFGFVADMMRK